MGLLEKKSTYRSHFDFLWRQNRHARETRFNGIFEGLISAAMNERCYDGDSAGSLAHGRPGHRPTIAVGNS